MWDWITALYELRCEGKPAVFVTVSGVSGSTPREPGAKMIVLPDGTIQGTIGGGQIEQHAIRDALDCLAKLAGGSFEYPLTATSGQCCGGTMELLMEVVNANPQLYIYGAGHVGQALCRVLANTVFVAHVIDRRPEWIAHPEMPTHVIRHEKAWQEFNESAVWDQERTYVAIMTPDHAEDFEIVAELLNRPLRYLGLIGSRAKWTRFQRSLLDQGFQQSQLDVVKCPIGVGDTGKAPAEIAISIAAELLRDYHANH